MSSGLLWFEWWEKMVASQGPQRGLADGCWNEPVEEYTQPREDQWPPSLGLWESLLSVSFHW